MQIKEEELNHILRALTERSDELTGRLHAVNAEREEVLHLLQENSIAYRVVDSLRKK